MEEWFLQTEVDVVVVEHLTLCDRARGTVITRRLESEGFRQREISGDLSAPAEVAFVFDGHFLVEHAFARDDRVYVEIASFQRITIEVHVVGEVHDFETILEAYKYRGYAKGARGIYMRLLHMNVLMNLKKIRRLMNKYGLKCPYRGPNPYRQMAKALKTNTVFPNRINREFFGVRTKICPSPIIFGSKKMC